MLKISPIRALLVCCLAAAIAMLAFPKGSSLKNSPSPERILADFLIPNELPDVELIYPGQKADLPQLSIFSSLAKLNGEFELLEGLAASLLLQNGLTFWQGPLAKGSLGLRWSADNHHTLDLFPNTGLRLDVSEWHTGNAGRFAITINITDRRGTTASAGFTVTGESLETRRQQSGAQLYLPFPSARSAIDMADLASITLGITGTYGTAMRITRITASPQDEKPLPFAEYTADPFAVSRKDRNVSPLLPKDDATLGAATIGVSPFAASQPATSSASNTLSTSSDQSSSSSSCGVTCNPYQILNPRTCKCDCKKISCRNKAKQCPMGGQSCQTEDFLAQPCQCYCDTVFTDCPPHYTLDVFAEDPLKHCSCRCILSDKHCKYSDGNNSEPDANSCKCKCPEDLAKRCDTNNPDIIKHPFRCECACRVGTHPCFGVGISASLDNCENCVCDQNESSLCLQRGGKRVPRYYPQDNRYYCDCSISLNISADRRPPRVNSSITDRQVTLITPRYQPRYATSTMKHLANTQEVLQDTSQDKIRYTIQIADKKRTLLRTINSSKNYRKITLPPGSFRIRYQVRVVRDRQTIDQTEWSPYNRIIIPDQKVKRVRSKDCSLTCEDLGYQYDRCERTVLDDTSCRLRIFPVPSAQNLFDEAPA